MSKPETTTLRGELPGVKLVGSTGATAGGHVSLNFFFISLEGKEPEKFCI